MTLSATILTWIGVTIALVIGGIITVAIAWRGDPSKGRRRCSRCWYDMSAVSGFRCPECGKVGRDEQALFRTRRFRKGLTMGSVLVLVGAYIGLATSRMGPNRETWTRWIPTTLLVFIAPVERAEQGHELAEAAWRRSRAMWRWQEAIIARREVAATSDEEILGWLRVRNVWPAGVSMPIRLSPEYDKWPLVGPKQVDLRSTDGRGIHLRSAIDSWPTRSIHDPAREPDWNDDGPPVAWEIEIPAMSIGRHTFEFEMTLSGSWGTSRTVTHSVEIVVTDREADVMTAVSSPAIDSLIADALWIVISDRNRDPWLLIHFDDQKIFDSLYRATYVSGKLPEPVLATVVEVVDGDKVLASFRLDWWGSRGLDWPPDLSSLIAAAMDPQTCEWKPEVIERLWVYVRGDLGLAARSVGPSSYWSGEIRMPLVELIERVRQEQKKREAT
jgi:hypothetical protein